MKKLIKPRFGLAALFIATVFWGISDIVANQVRGDLPQTNQAVWQEPARSAVTVSNDTAITSGIQADGNIITQDIELNAGWNAI